MPRSLQPDKKLFGVTLALCLIGAVMVFSASAMTASEQFGAGYIFLLRQLIYVVLGIAGMFYLMNMDYHKLRQPRVVFTGLAVTFVCWSACFSWTVRTRRIAGSAWALSVFSRRKWLSSP